MIKKDGVSVQKYNAPNAHVDITVFTMAVILKVRYVARMSSTEEPAEKIIDRIPPTMVRNLGEQFSVIYIEPEGK